MSEKVLPFDFGSTLEDRTEEVLGAVTEEEGMLLTEILLSYDGIYPSDNTAALTDRGLAFSGDDGKLHVGEKGMKAVSLFPLLGTKAKRRPYPEAFIPFLLSAVASSTLQSGRWQKMITSDFFTALFPGIEKERIAGAAVKAMDRLLKLGIADDSEGEIRLRRPEAESFMRLTEEERLALIIKEGCEHNREERERTALYIHLALLLSGISEDRIEKYLDLIAFLSGTAVPEEDLFLFSILDENDGIISGREFPGKRDTLAVSSDFSITYTGTSPGEIYLYASPIMTDSITEWKLTKSSLKAAFSLDMTPDDVRASLSELSSFPLPDTLYPRISGWFSSFSSLHADRVLLLTADERNARIIDALPTLRIHIIGKIGDNLFLMNTETEPLWRRALENAGFDMLGPTSGPHFEKTMADENKLPPRSFNPPEIREEREIAFSEEQAKMLSDSTADPLRKILILSGFIVAEAQPTPSIDTVNGLYYQEKLRLIHSAITEGKKLYAEFVDGSVLVGKAERTDEERISVNGHLIEIARIWRTAILPKGIKDLELHPSDNDSQ